MSFGSIWNCSPTLGVKAFSWLLPVPGAVGANSCGPPVSVSNEYLVREKRAPSVPLSRSVSP